MFNVKYSQGFDLDLAEIYDFISQDSVKRAKSFVKDIRDSILKLSDNPLMCPYSNIAELAEIGIRVKVYFKYLVFYSVNQENEIVDILRIKHGSTNYIKFFL